MSEFWLNFHFLRPELLLLLVFPLVLYWRFFKGVQSQSSWEKVCDKRLLDFLLVRGSARQRKYTGYLAFWGMIIALVAAAGPSWQKREIPSLTPENPLMLVLNLSSDMEEKDITPSRLERAKYKISDLFKYLKTTQVGLMVYSDEPFLISPVTEDVKIIENLLPAVTREIMPINGDRPDRAISLAVEKLKNASYTRGNILLITPEAGQGFDLSLAAGKKAKQAGFEVSILGISQDSKEKLKLMADAGGGIYLPYTPGDEDVKKLAQLIGNQTQELKLSENLCSQWLDAGYSLLIVPLLCCLYFFRRGIVWLLVLSLWSPQAQAGFFLNNNQEGLRAFEQQDYQKAAEKFENADWKGSSLYRLGDYEKAYQNFSQAQDVTSLYNQGNALAKAGKLKEAMAKYEEVLKQAPEHEDAKFNLEYLKKQQENQEQNQENQQGQQNQTPDSQSEQQEQSSGEQQNQAQNEQQQENEQEQSQGEAQQQEMSEKQDKNASEEAQQEIGEPENKEEKTEAMQAQQGKEEKAEYDEKAQAMAQQYREIPENPGGLLKAFIRREYLKKRYEK